MIVRGKLHVRWSGSRNAHGHYQPHDIAVKNAVILDRSGDPMFAPSVVVDPTRVVAKDVSVINRKLIQPESTMIIASVVSAVRPQFAPAAADLARASGGAHSAPGHGVLYVIALVGRGLMELPLLVVGHVRREDDCVSSDGRAFYQFDLGMAVMNLRLTRSIVFSIASSGDIRQHHLAVA